MKQLQKYWTIARKEFFSYLNSATAYVVLAPFLAIAAFLFFRSALVLNDANMRPFVELLPWFLMIIGPALAMRSFTDEQRKDTSELLFAHPVSEWTVVWGKFTGLMLFYGLMLFLTLPIPLTLALFSTPDPGIIISQYIGMIYVGGVFMAIGIAASALVGSAVGSFLLATAINFGLVLLGMSFVVLLFPGFIGRIVNEIAIMPHLASVSRGVIDLRDIFYFTTLALTALALTTLKLAERKVAEIPAEKKKLWLIVILILGLGLITNVLMYEFPLRWDLTAARRYSLSRGTKTLLQQLPDRVTISLYTSQNLPGPMQVTLRETSDWLKDYKRFGKKIALRTVITDAAPANKQEAIQRGIREVQFNQIGSNSFQVQTGFLGLELRYGDKTEVIDFIEDASNLEYRLSRAILKLTGTNAKSVGLYVNSNTPYEQLETMLGGQYELTAVAADMPTEEIASLAGIVVVDSGTQGDATVAAQLNDYVRNGGNVAMFIDGVLVDQRNLSAAPSQSVFINLLKDYGITISPSLVYDLQLNEPVTMGQGAVRYIIPYPFWIRTLVQAQALPANNTVTNTLLGWASRIDTDNQIGWQTSPLLKTGKSAGAQTGKYIIDPNNLQSIGQPSGEQVVGIISEKDQQRMSVIGDSDVVSNEFLSNSVENQIFTANIIDWIVADPILNQIPRRSPSRTVFTFTSAGQATLVQYANIAGPALVAVGFGTFWLWRRKQLAKRVR